MSSPIKASFDLIPDYPYHCLNGAQVVMGASIINVLTDFMTTVVPMPLIWKLKLARRQRLAVIGIFGIGIVVTVASSVRTYYAWFQAFGTSDTTWWGWATILAASIEINLGLVCHSPPASLDGPNNDFIRYVHPHPHSGRSSRQSGLDSSVVPDMEMDTPTSVTKTPSRGHHDQVDPPTLAYTWNPMIPQPPKSGCQVDETHLTDQVLFALSSCRHSSRTERAWYMGVL